MKCRFCNNNCIKKGKVGSRQRYLCKGCKRYQQNVYVYKKISAAEEKMIVRLNREGVGISGLSRILGSSKSNIVNRIMKMSLNIRRPVFMEEHQKYEADEMHTYVRSKKNACYIIYAINRASRKVIDLEVGSRTKQNINKVISSVKRLNPGIIYTDKLNVYPGLMEGVRHETKPYKINRIERMNLTLRTHIKRLSRRTICFSKSEAMLVAVLKLYFWG